MGSLTRFRRLLPSIRPPFSLRSLSLPVEAPTDDDAEPIDQRRLPADYNPATFDPTEHRSPPTARVFRLVDEIASLTLSEVSELSSILVRMLSLPGPPTIAVMEAKAAAEAAKAASPAAARQEEEKTEKTVFEVRLESFDAAAKLKVIKEVRGMTDLGLKEAKELVEKAPAVFKSGVSREEGELILEKMKAAGAKAILV